MATTKKTTPQVTGLDPKIQAIIDEEFADYEKYLPSPQDRKVYRRKRIEYWDRISARLKEETISDGRTDIDAAASANN